MEAWCLQALIPMSDSEKSFSSEEEGEFAYLGQIMGSRAINKDLCVRGESEVEAEHMEQIINVCAHVSFDADG